MRLRGGGPEGDASAHGQDGGGESGHASGEESGDEGEESGGEESGGEGGEKSGEEGSEPDENGTSSAHSLCNELTISAAREAHESPTRCACHPPPPLHVATDMMTTSEMKTNGTMQKTKTTTNDASECVPLAPAALTRQIARARTPPSESHEQNKNPAACAHRWRQSMRARLGIDTSKSWADWVEEEDEAATLIVTPEDGKADAEPKCEPTLPLGMRLRGGGPEGESDASGDGSGDESGRQPALMSTLPAAIPCFAGERSLAALTAAAEPAAAAPTPSSPPQPQDEARPLQRRRSYTHDPPIHDRQNFLAE